jgi:hypothetical protein
LTSSDLLLIDQPVKSFGRDILTRQEEDGWANGTQRQSSMVLPLPAWQLVVLELKAGTFDPGHSGYAQRDVMPAAA